MNESVTKVGIELLGQLKNARTADKLIKPNESDSNIHKDVPIFKI